MKKKFKVFVASMLLFSSITAQTLPDVKMAEGKYLPTWESTAEWECPEWYKDAKFGIWAHWGPQCEPEYGDWYARYMYAPGYDQYNYHINHYGNPQDFGLKDLCNAWKAENWDPNELVSLYKSIGAKYFFALGNHHDNFDLWNSPYQEWNSVNIGPKRDLLKGWSDACEKNGLPFGISIHAARAWLWLELSQDFDGNLTKEDGIGKWWEGYDPQELYAQRHTPSQNYRDPNAMFGYWDWYPNTGWSIPTEAYKRKFQNRVMECINDYHPDIIYFDDTVLPFWGCDNQIGLNILSHYYNQRINETGKDDVVVTGKILQDYMKESMMWDVERGIPDLPQEKYWQTCTCLGDWHYNIKYYDNNWYKSAQQVINMLVDIVSKNGNMLLSVPLKGDGTIDDKEKAILLDIKEWMNMNGRSIFGTRVWKSFGEGPLVDAYNPMSGPGFNENINYSANDVRYVIKYAKTETEKDTLFATIMRWPSKNNFTFKNLGYASEFYSGEIDNIELLGETKPIKYIHGLEGLTVELPNKPINNICPVFAFTFKEGTEHPLTLEQIIKHCEQLATDRQSHVGCNTGQTSILALNAFITAIKEAQLHLSDEETEQEEAKQNLLEAWRIFQSKGFNSAITPLNEGKDYTLKFLHEATAFSRTDASKGLRWGEPLYWTVENYAINDEPAGIKKGLDNWPGFENLYLGVWNDRDKAEGELQNSRIYQRIHLPAGKWFFGTTFDTHSGLDDAFFFVANELLTTNELPDQAIAYSYINQMPIGSMTGLSFILDQEQDVVLGFQANLAAGANQQEFRAKEVRLIHYGTIDIKQLKQLINTAESALKSAEGNGNITNFPTLQADNLLKSINTAKALDNQATMTEIILTQKVLEAAFKDFLASLMQDVTTDYLQNPSFEDDGSAMSYQMPKGWNVDCNCSWWGVNKSGGKDNPQATDGQYLFGVWDKSNTANATISQKVFLPAGYYRLSVDMHASNRNNAIRVGRQRIFAGKNEGLFYDQIITPGQNDEYPLQTIYIDFEQEKASEINIGVTTSDAPEETWFKIDNFRLFRSQIPNTPPTAICTPSTNVHDINDIYTLNGIRTDNMQKNRIYIINNKKILIH